jgi:hypothetical protein
MTLSQRKEKLLLSCFMLLLLFLIGTIYCLHLFNQNSTLSIADKNFVFAMTSWFEIAFLIAVLYSSKKYFCEKDREKISFIAGCNALMALGGVFLIRMFWIGAPPTWISDLFIQDMAISMTICIASVPKKGDYTLPLSMIFPLVGTFVYLCYRF